MRQTLRWCALLCILFSFGLVRGLPRLHAAPRSQAATTPSVTLIEFHDTLQPERANVFLDSLDRARREHAAAILVNLSSPGGMTQPTDRMVDAIRRSPVPVIVWAGAGNSRISGEALRLMAEADVALMGKTQFLTPLWTETPRNLKAGDREAGSQRLAKALLQATAAHGRKPDAVDELSRGVHWFNAQEALQAGFIDGIAEKQPDVLRFITQHGIRKNGVHRDMDLSAARVTMDLPSPQSDLLLALMNPNLCVLLFTLGLLLLYLEINTPGVVVPGATGVLLILLATYSLSRLPLNGYGILLCATAIVLLLLETQGGSSTGLLAVAGVAALVAGLGSLVQGPLPQLQVSWATAAGAGIGFGGVTASLVLLGMEARRSKVRTGSDAMLGWLAVAQTPLSPEGQILVRGELWRARLTSSAGTVAAGDPVKVLRADGLTLEVSAIPIASVRGEEA